MLLALAPLALAIAFPAAPVHLTGSPASGFSGCSSSTSKGNATCLAKATTASAQPAALTPADIQAAYAWPTKSNAGSGETIAIVDAKDNPLIESDLATFDAAFGLPPCTTANGCFTKVDASGGTKYPSADNGWGFEIDIDVEWAHAIAPGAKILLVEAQSNGVSQLLQAEDYAKAHAQYVSNSWIGNEYGSETTADRHFIQPGVSFFAASGDLGLVNGYPAASPNVISVGGTQLNYSASGQLLSESGWSGGGGGCSKDEVASAAQQAFAYYDQVGCGGARAFPDISSDGSSASAVSVYDGMASGQTPAAWYGAYGTSVATALVAARAADAGIVVDASTVYGSALSYRDITDGGNGATCYATYNLCAGRGSWTGSRP